MDLEYFLYELLNYMLMIPTVLIALSFHECAHGFVAYKLGDPTAKHLGRLTLNPIKHIDPLGALCMLLCRFGWAKPVPVRMMNFKKPKTGMAITALAGPVTNLLLAFIGCFFLALAQRFLPMEFTEKSFSYWMVYILINFLYFFAWLNISLAVFNLIPLPPFDGSRVLSAFLSDKYYMPLLRYEREIAIGFFAILYLDSRFLGGYISGGLSFLVNGIYNSMMSLFYLFL